MPQSNAGVASKRSCLRCNERKVRCDRNHPCGRCLQAKVECSFPRNKRASRKLNRPPIATILGQLKELEQEVERLRASSVTSDDNLKSIQQSCNGPGQQAPEQVQTADTQASTSGRVSGDKGDRHGQADDRISGLHVARDRSSNQALGAGGTFEHSTHGRALPSFGVPLLNSEPEVGVNHDHQLQPLQVRALWVLYKENVAPIIAMLHKSTIEPMIIAASAQTESSLPIAFEALVQAICFSAIVSATPEQCLFILGRDRDVCIRTSRLAVEQALARANLISTPDIKVLQAAVLFLLCLRWLDPRLAWAETAIVVRVAQRQGLHREGQAPGLSPFNNEMRRRLWWHICILDFLCSEDQGTDTQIRPEIFNTKIPSNVDIDDLAPDRSIPSPPRSGFTDITLCIIQSEIMLNLYWPGINLNPESTQSAVTERENVLCSLATRVEEQYLRNFDLDVPIQWLTAVIVRLSLSKVRVVSLLKNTKAGEIPVATKDEIFNMAVEIVKFANLIEKNEPTAQWAWVCKGYKQRHVVAFILSELCTRPISPETNQAWEITTEMYNQWRQESHDTDTAFQNSLSRLMQRATASRARRLESLKAPRDDRTSLPVPRSIIHEHNPIAALAADLDVQHSRTPATAGIDDLLDDEFTFSAIDWLSAPLM